MSTSRKIFAAQVTLPLNTPTSLYQLMRDSPLHWGFETTALTTPSLDSIIGSEAGIIPDGTVFVGSDANVRGNTAAPYYKGVTVLGGTNFSLQDFGYGGLIDPNQIFFYSGGGTAIDVIFQAR